MFQILLLYFMFLKWKKLNLLKKSCKCSQERYNFNGSLKLVWTSLCKRIPYWQPLCKSAWWLCVLLVQSSFLLTCSSESQVSTLGCLALYTPQDWAHRGCYMNHRSSSLLEIACAQALSPTAALLIFTKKSRNIFRQQRRNSTTNFLWDKSQDMFPSDRILASCKYMYNFSILFTNTVWPFSKKELYWINAAKWSHGTMTLQSHQVATKVLFTTTFS